MAKKKLLIILGIIIAILVLAGIIFLLFNKVEFTGKAIYGICTGTLDCTSEPVEECISPTCSWVEDSDACIGESENCTGELVDNEKVECESAGCTWVFQCVDAPGCSGIIEEINCPIVPHALCQWVSDACIDDTGCTGSYFRLEVANCPGYPCAPYYGGSSCVNVPDESCTSLTNEPDCSGMGGCSWTTCTDNDDDNYGIEGGDCGEVDCDDSNPDTYPGAIETCNEIDDDCNGLIDDGIDCPCGEGYGECECGDIMLGNVILSENMECNGTEQVSYALALGAEGITLDCNGNSITGNEIGIGVKFIGVTGATIKNCKINEFSQGILSGNVMTGNNYILNNTLKNNSQYGIAIRQASNYIIQDNELTNSSIGIRIVSSSGNVIDNNTIINSLEKGISLYNADSNDITNNTVQNANVGGIYLYSTGFVSNNLVQGNTISLSETDEAPLSKYGIRIEDDNNEIYDNTIDCTSINGDYNNRGIFIYGSDTNAEDNVLSRNEVSNCYEGLSAWNVDYFEASDEDYYNNTYGAYFSGSGISSTMPLIRDSNIYNNTHGVYLTSSSYAAITDTNFTNNRGGEGGGHSGIHVDSTSTAIVVNGNFESNGNYGIYDAGPDRVEWTFDKNVYCTDNNIEIPNGFIIPLGGEIITDNCTITINGEEMNLSGGQTGSYSETYNEGNTFGNASYGVTGEVHTIGGAYSGDLIVDFYEENPGGSGFLLADFGLWVDASLDPVPADLSWWMLKIYYTDEDLTASGLNEADLIIQFYNATDNTWTTELDQGVEEDENYVWANLTHFSIFGLFEEEEAGTSSTREHWTPTNKTNVTSNVSIEQPETAAPETTVAACESELGGKICLIEETCNGERLFLEDGICCFGECEKKESSLWLIVAIVAAVAIVIAISFRLLRHRKH